MKKIMLTSIIVIIALVSVNAQDDNSKSSRGEFNIGFNVGFAIGDISEAASAAVHVEVNYLFSISDAFKVGPSISFVDYFLDDVSGDDVSFLPIAAAARYNVFEKLEVGVDLGYGVGLTPSGNEGGFYYRPMIGYNIFKRFMLQATYSGISVDGGTFENFGIGATFSI